MVKVGTSTLTYSTGRVNIRRVETLIKVLSDIANSGKQVVLVSSGALSVGGGKLGLKERPKDTPTRQAVSAIGQCELMYLYDNLFSQYHHTVGQVLLTKEIINDAHRWENVQNTFEQLLNLGAIPIVNENDTVSVDELEGEQIGDNDTLSALVAQRIGADALVLISDIAGLYTANPRTDENARLIPVVTEIDDKIRAMASGTGSSRGTGGMITKVSAAEVATSAGIDMVIMSGERPELLYDLIDGKSVGTHFLARGKS